MKEQTMNSMMPEYNTMTFNDVFDSSSEFINAMNDYKETLDDDHLELTFLLLSSKYGNSPIANRSVNQFKLKLWSTIFQYGPAWVKRLDIQDKVMSLNLDSGDLFVGTGAVMNHAFNPSSSPSTSSLEELEYINDQNTTKYKKGKVEAYSNLLEILDDSVSEDYVAKFRDLFKQFVMPEDTLLFITEEGDD